MTEWVFNAAEEPTVFIRDRRHFRRSQGYGARHNGGGIFDDQQQPHSAPA